MSDAPEPLRLALAERYTFERELGRGGMATVYLAQDLKHRRAVAIKVLRSELSLAPARFLREISIAAQLVIKIVHQLVQEHAAAGVWHVSGQDLPPIID